MKKFYLRLNGNPRFQIEVKHIEKISDTEAVIKDKAVFPPGAFKQAVRIVLAELLDEMEVLWAMRRMPEHFAPLGVPSVEYIFNWRLTITQGEQEAVTDKPEQKERRMLCEDCKFAWVDSRTEEPVECPSCRSKDISRNVIETDSAERAKWDDVT